MAYLLQGLFGQWSLSKVAGVFSQQAQAETAMEALRNEAGLSKTQVRLLCPQDANDSHRELFGRTAQTAPAAARRILVHTHLAGGLAGALTGLALFLWLDRASNPLVTNSPSVAFVAIVGFGMTFGLMAAGLVALRPDHIVLISQVRTALKANRWVVIADPVNGEETAKVKRVLEASPGEVRSSV